MLPIAPGKPLLEHLIELLRDQGVSDFIINVHYLPETITSYFGDGSKLGVRIRYSDESQQILETAGALWKARDMLDDNFILIYGDQLHFLDLSAALELHRKNNGLATIILKNSQYPQDGEVGEFDAKTNRITYWHTRPHEITELRDTRLVNAGVYVLSKKILDYIRPDVPVKLDGEAIPKALAAGEVLYATPTSATILDIGKPEKYERAKEFYKEQKAGQV